jgi:hypothetical protein
MVQKRVSERDSVYLRLGREGDRVCVRERDTHTHTERETESVVSDF